MSRDLIQKALSFYENSPDGQYDVDVVVPLIKSALNQWQPIETALETIAADLVFDCAIRHFYATGNTLSPLATDKLRDGIAKATRDEREACALLAEEHSANTGRVIAPAIRARNRAEQNG